MSLSFYDIVPEVLIDKVFIYAGRCVNCDKVCSGDIVPELGEYYCFEECGPEYKHFDTEFDYRPFADKKYLRGNVHLGKAFLSYLKTHYLYNRLNFEHSTGVIKIRGINHYKYEFEYELDDDLEDYEYLLNYFEGHMERLIVDIMKNTLEHQLPEPCCTNGRVIGSKTKWCKCSYALSYRLTNYFETKDVDHPLYVTYIDDVKILDMLKHLYKNVTGGKDNAVIFVPNECESYTNLFVSEEYGTELDYDEKIKTKYGSFIVVDQKDETVNISECFEERLIHEYDDNDSSALQDTSILDYIETMSSPILMKYHNSFFDEDLLNLLHIALNYGGDEEYIAIVPKIFLESSAVFLESMMGENTSYPFKYIETDEAFFFSSCH